MSSGHLPGLPSSSSGLPNRRPGMGQRRSTEPLPPLLPRLPTDDTESVLDAVSEEGTQTTQGVQSAQVPGPVPSKPRPPGKASKPPANPRDHSILDFIYCEMHSQRFVNMEPLSLLANSLGIYFTGTHDLYATQKKCPFLKFWGFCFCLLTLSHFFGVDLIRCSNASSSHCKFPSSTFPLENTQSE